MRTTPRMTHRTISADQGRPSVRGISTIKDSGVSAPVVGEDDLRRARLTVCRAATDLADAQMLMAMLGIDPPTQRRAQQKQAMRAQPSPPSEATRAGGRSGSRSK